MKSTLLAILLCAAALPAISQQTPPAAQENQPGAGATPNTGDAARSALEVKPGKPTIKTREIGSNQPFGPIYRLPKYILADQKKIWTSPFRTSKENAKWWGIFGGATLGLIALDKHIMKQVPDSHDTVLAGKWGSRIGAAYTLLPLSAGFYFLGSASHDERFRETGILAFEAIASTTIVETVLKAATQRERPTEGTGSGRFWQGQGRFWNNGASFPSGHAINSFALASVFAHEYPRPRIIPILAYTMAGTVVMSRMAAHKHFPSDIVAGSALGWFIGDFVYWRRHNRTLDAKPSAFQRVLSHVRVGVAIAP